MVKGLLRGAHFEATYFCSQILSQIDQNRPLLQSLLAAEDQRRGTILHFDNAALHTARETAVYLECHRICRAPHPPFSPDLAAIRPLPIWQSQNHADRSGVQR
jgi:hypothetical protein